MEHYNCVLDISKLLKNAHTKLIEQICKDLGAEDRTDELLKKYMSSEFSKMKPKKDPNLPKKPKSSYMLCCGEHRDEVKANSKTKQMGEMSKTLGAMWKKLSEEDKEPYLTKSEEAKEEYNEQMNNYM